jgi:hypothetical protein
MQTRNYIRQGDVYLIPIGTLPQGLTKKNNVLAHGEKTGHRHQFLEQSVETFVDSNDQQFISLDHDADLVHEEHHQIHVPPGYYRVAIQREYDITEGVRPVLD